MTDKELFEEFNFLREKIYEISGCIARNEKEGACFMLGNIYADLRTLCLKYKPVDENKK